MNKLNQKVTNEKLEDDKNLMEDFLIRTVSKIVHSPKLTLALVLLITTFFGAQLTSLKFDYDFNSFFPKGDAHLAFYEEINQDFGEYNNFLFVNIQSDSIRTEKVLTRLKSFTDSLRTFPEVLRIESPFSQFRFQATPFGINKIPLVKTDGITIEEIEARNLTGRFFGKDAKSILLLVHHRPLPNKSTGDRLYQKIQSFTDSQLPYENIISGKTQMQYAFTNKLENEVGKLLCLAFLVVVISLWLIFRSLKGVILPLLVLITTIIWMMGFVSLINKPLDIMAIIIPALLLIISLSDVIHFVNKYDFYRSKGFIALEAITEAIKTVGKATFLTSLSTAIGFASLLVIPIQPIQDFGLLTALGVLMAFLITIIIIPALLTLFSKPVESSKTSKIKWNQLTNRTFLFVLKNQKRTIYSLTGITIILLLGIQFLKINTSILVGLQKGEPELETVQYFDENFDGYKPFEIGIEIEQDNLFNENVFIALDSLDSFLNSLGVRQVSSPLNLVKEINSSIKGGLSSKYAIPIPNDFERVKRLYNARRLSDIRSFYQSENYIRFIGRLPDSGSSATAPLYQEVIEYLSDLDKKHGFKARLTGTSYLIDQTDNYVVSSIFKGLGVGIISVSIFIFLFFGSHRILLISLVPNFLPVAIIAALMGWLNIDLNITTAIVFTITFGIAVDDTIHFLSKYQMELKGSNSKIWALKKAMNHTGKSIIITSLIICFGFLVFLSSGFSVPYFMGLLIVLSTLFALVYDLVLLPILLSRFRD